jgi:predicted permease
LKRLLVALVARLSDRALADSIAGDLEEARAANGSSSSRHVFRYWRTAWGIVMVVVLTRLRDTTVRMLRGAFSSPGGDLRFAARSLRRTPWFAVTALAVMALSMALATTTFTVVDGVLFKPLPYPDAEELYRVGGSFQRYPQQSTNVSARDLRDWSAAVPEVKFSAIGSRYIFGRVGDFTSRTLAGAGVDERFFDVIGLHPVIGGFSADDFALEDSRVALISHALWQQHFGGRPDVVGQRLEFPGSPSFYRVAGVLPKGFLFPGEPARVDLLVPFRITPRMWTSRERRLITLVARVPASQALPVVQEKLDAAAIAAKPDFPANSRLAYGAFDRVNLTPVSETLTSQTRPTFGVAFAAAAALVVLACLNLAGLAAARARDRARDVALRRALGASAGRLVRLQLAEGLLLAAGGAALGLAAAPMLLSVTVQLLPDSVEVLKTPALDGRVLAFAALASVCVAMLVSMLPAVAALRPGLAPILARESSTTTRGGRIARPVLIGCQIAVTLVLVIGGSLLVASLAKAWHEDPGFTTDDTVIVDTSLGYGDNGRVQTAGIVDLLRRIPGVRQVAAFDGPFLDGGWRADLGWKNPPGARRGCLAGQKAGVTAEFFDVFGLKPTRGRLPTATELDAGLPLAVVSQRTVETCWPSSDPIGQPFEIGGRQYTVAGVVSDLRWSALDETMPGAVFVSTKAIQPSTSVFALRTAGPPHRYIQPVISTLRDAGVLARVSRVTTMDDALSSTIRARQLYAWLFGIFAGAALVIVTVGVLGLTAMTTARRTREFAIRCALGGAPHRMARLVLREQVMAVLAGLVAGSVVAFWATEFLESYLYQLQPGDVGLWSASLAAIALTAFAGTLVPAVRASRVDPVQALRVE